MTINEERRRRRVLAWLGSAIHRLAPLAMASAVVVSSTPVGAQEDSRRLWDSEFLSKRAPGAAKPRPRKAPTYRVATPPPPAADRAAPGEIVGVTVWRLRRSLATDSGESRLLVQETGDQRAERVEWTPERVEAETPFAAGDRVRLSIESPRAGYLYVIDRELYADGTTSDPYLIFPTRRMRDGDNAVRAGRVIELPGQSAFRLTPLRPDYQGERLTILVTSEPLPQVTVPADAERLAPSLVAQWETQWAVAAERLELVGGAGRAYTGVERDAAAQGRLLTQGDELPQTLYRVLAAPGAPVMISVPLKIAK
jgi:hypothetical protein